MSRLCPIAVLLCLVPSGCVVGDTGPGLGPGPSDAPELGDQGPDASVGRPDGSTSPPDAGQLPPVVDDPLEAGTYTETFTVLGEQRDVLVFVPATWQVGDPAVVALHGNGDTPQNFLAWTGLGQVAEQNGFAVALPDADSGHYQGLDWDAYSDPATNVDIQHVIAARDYLLDGGASASRTYLLGHSQGGFLAFHVAMNQSTTFAAVHVASAASPLGSALAPTAERKIPVDLLIGENDSLIGPANDTMSQLQSLSFDTRYTVIPQMGHCCPIQGRVGSVWSWLSSKQL